MWCVHIGVRLKNQLPWRRWSLFAWVLSQDQVQDHSATAKCSSSIKRKSTWRREHMVQSRLPIDKFNCALLMGGDLDGKYIYIKSWLLMRGCREDHEKWVKGGQGVWPLNLGHRTLPGCWLSKSPMKHSVSISVVCGFKYLLLENSRVKIREGFAHKSYVDIG